MQAVILAGGKGTRLLPYTASLPKPLMPIGDIPILEILVRQLKSQGVTSIIMAVGHLHQMIEGYFKNGEKYNIPITYSLEEEPLGTAGPIKLFLDQLEENFIILNGDLLTTLSFRDLFKAHLNKGVSATIATFSRRVDIDYGVLNINKDSYLDSYDEKPSFDYKVSMGINVLNKEDIVPIINQYNYLDIPDLMMQLIGKNKKVFCYQETCDWLDIGRVEDYSIAVEKFEKNKEKFLPK